MKKRTKNNILQEIKVDEEKELLTFLIDKNVRKSRNAIKSLLTHKQIYINQKIVTQYNYELKKGDIITIQKHDIKFDEKKLKGLTIIYEDKDIVVVDKDSGLLSVSTGKELMKETAYRIVNQYIQNKSAKNKAYILYRLDRETSGLMVFAKSEDMQEALQAAWTKQPPQRSFQAIVEGRPTPANGTITSWLTENKNFVMFSSLTDNGGQESTTHYKTIQANRKYSLLKINQETYRKNQIRVHLQSIGHSIIGDKKYGSTINPIRRIALHADELSFIHPISKKKLEFKSPLPKKMQIIADSLVLSKDS
ncbi:MAG: RluA family pseudouridine synthase [Dysgonomonas sp.]|nr:RluA family pseudouridine synthase [Dysgonomonas sp.]